MQDYDDLAQDYAAHRRAEPAVVTVLVAGGGVGPATRVLEAGCGLLPYRHDGPRFRSIRTFRQRSYAFLSVEVCLPITRLSAQRPFGRKVGSQTEAFAMKNAIPNLNRPRQPNVLPFSASRRFYLGIFGLDHGR